MHGFTWREDHGYSDQHKSYDLYVGGIQVRSYYIFKMGKGEAWRTASPHINNFDYGSKKEAKLAVEEEYLRNYSRADSKRSKRVGPAASRRATSHVFVPPSTPEPPPSEWARCTQYNGHTVYLRKSAVDSLKPVDRQGNRTEVTTGQSVNGVFILEGGVDAVAKLLGIVLE